ncbi:MAG: LON peptidase substrate-binding domain-containing protein [Alphaproteobacteria bacterium]|nr:LON peptidase substrate-binding domain-containing protein [Alphaproteobacteria bacterium]MBL7096252.1 LON peptidase substrate-binding domain-containing protein [Alphaproteobacteria bacterium]
MAGRYHSIDDLPPLIGIFPLPGVLLLPRGHLPLNVFEPRYLALVEAALSGSRLIGMIQPTESEEKTLKPRLSGVGCAGRITGYRETEDNRYLITLTGICRFRVAQEVAVDTPFRQVQAEYRPFAGDLAEGDETDFPRDRVLAALNDYLSRRELKADWRSVMNAPAETLVNALAMLCPFEPAEKQALLEAPSWTDRVTTLLALLEMAGTAPGPSSVN